VKGPTRKIVGWYRVDDRIPGGLREVLDCGHAIKVQVNKKFGNHAMLRRACVRCEQGLPPDVDPYGASVLRMGGKS
jgi:hypothetical protein